MARATPIILHDLLPEPGASPYSHRVKIALVELEIPFTTRFVDLNSKSEEFVSLFRGIVQDPEASATAPIIVDGNYKLTDSLPILEYLDKKYGRADNKILPEDACQYGKVKLFVEIFQPQVVSNFVRILKADTKAALAEAARSLDAALKVLNNFIKVNGTEEGGNFFLGSRYSLAEVATTPFLVRAITVLSGVGKYDVLQSIKVNGLKRLGSWVEASLSRPSARSTCCSEELMFQTTGARYNQPLKD